MENFHVDSSTLNNQYTYIDDYLYINGNYAVDTTTNKVQNVNGTVYRNNGGNKGDYVGNFSGFLRDDEMRYSISEMSRKDANHVWDAIDEIEANIMGENEA